MYVEIKCFVEVGEGAPLVGSEFQIIKEIYGLTPNNFKVSLIGEGQGERKELIVEISEPAQGGWTLGCVPEWILDHKQKKEAQIQMHLDQSRDNCV